MSSTLSSLVNHQVRLASRPVGMATAENWQFTEEPVAEPADGTVLVKTLELSLDPAMRGWLNEGKSYIPPVGIGEVMRAGGIGRVVASEGPGLRAGRHGQRPARRAGILPVRRRPARQPQPAEDRPAGWARRRNGSTSSACRA